MFLTPLFWPTNFVKSTDQFSEKSPPQTKNLGSLNFKKFVGFLEIQRFLTVFSGFQSLHNEKFGNSFFQQIFHFRSKKIGDDVWFSDQRISQKYHWLSQEKGWLRFWIFTYVKVLLKGPFACFLPLILPKFPLHVLHWGGGNMAAWDAKVPKNWLRT